MTDSESQPVLILGGGRGSLAFVELFKDEKLFHIVGIADQNPKASAFKLAKKLNIPTFTNIEDASNACKPCTVFNLTSDESVSDMASKIVGSNSVIGGLEATLIWQMVTQLKDTRDELQKMVHFDVVTGLPNRTLFFDRFKNALAQAKRHDQKLAILFLDLDGFKSVNDTFGHVAGDTVLKEVATRLPKAIREVDAVARFGGDEFVLLLNNVKNEKNTALVADKIMAALSEPFIIDGETCKIGASIGISIFPDDDVDMDSLISQADTAMYTAKNGGKNNYRFFEESMRPT